MKYDKVIVVDIRMMCVDIMQLSIVRCKKKVVTTVREYFSGPVIDSLFVLNVLQHEESSTCSIMMINSTFRDSVFGSNRKHSSSKQGRYITVSCRWNHYIPGSQVPPVFVLRRGHKLCSAYC